MKKGVHKAQPVSFVGLMPLVVPVPPMLEKAVGYTGEARFVAFYWGAGDEAYYDDGQRSGTGNWQGYLAYMHHPVVHPLLRAYDFGSSDSDAQHWMILDRDERKLFVAPLKAAQKFLAQRWPERKTIRMTQEEWNAFVMQALKNVQRQRKEIDMAEIHRRIEEQYAIVEAMQDWLSQFLPN